MIRILFRKRWNSPLIIVNKKFTCWFVKSFAFGHVNTTWSSFHIGFLIIGCDKKYLIKTGLWVFGVKNPIGNI